MKTPWLKDGVTMLIFGQERPELTTSVKTGDSDSHGQPFSPGRDGGNLLISDDDTIKPN